MKRPVFILLAIALISLLLPSSAFASHGDPIGSCPGKFELHHFMDHGEHDEHHIGVDKDLNGDGWICVKQISPDLHVHIDNVKPLR